MKLLSVVLLLFLVGCQNNNIFSVTPRTYGLKGDVVSFSEKSFTVNCDENWNYSVDTINSYNLLINRFFDGNSNLILIEYLYNDTIFHSKVIHEPINYTGKINSSQFDKNDEVLSYTRLVSFKDSIAFVETLDKNKLITSNTWTKYVNNQMMWQKSLVLKDSLYTEWAFIRDNVGQQIKMQIKLGFDKDKDFTNVFIKYLKFDDVGNWTERIDYEEGKLNDCMVKVRRINYRE